jgi:hypothetical protein
LLLARRKNKIFCRPTVFAFVLNSPIPYRNRFALYWGDLDQRFAAPGDHDRFSIRGNAIANLREPGFGVKKADLFHGSILPVN